MTFARSCALCLSLLVLFGQTLSRADTFRIAVGEWPPFITQQTSGFGYHSQLIERVFAAQGHELALTFLPWRRSLELVRRGHIPATFSWSYVASRTQDVLYPSVPVDTLKDVYFYRSDRFPGPLPALTFDEIRTRGLSVVGIGDYWYEEPLKAAGVTFQTVSTVEEAWQMLLNGRADLYIENNIVGRQLSLTLLGRKARQIAMTDPIRTKPVYILFSRRHPDGPRMLQIWEAGATPGRHSAARQALR